MASLAIAFALSSTAITTSARADECTPSGGISTCIDSDLLWPHTGATPFTFLGTSHVTPVGQVAFGFVASYASRPIVLVGGGPSPDGREAFAVDNLLTTTYLFSVGVAQGFELSIAAPMTLYQDGAGLSLFRPQAQDLPRSTVRDLRFGFSYELIPAPRTGSLDGWGLTTRLEFVAPTGDGDAFAGAASGAVVPSVTADFRYGPLLLAADVGARIRENVTFADARWGSQIVGGLGADVTIVPSVDFSLGAEAFVAPAVSAQASVDHLVPAEWSAHAAIAPALGGDISFQVAGGGAIPFTDASLTAPRFRFGLGIRYAPRGTDKDGDGVLDRDDACPDAIEDRDGFQDADGCPDLDNDGDRIPDETDACRDEAETPDGKDDEDGCPDYDDDGDGIPDEVDRCRSDKEDIDRFEDEDGCPELDNDRDGIPDGVDECPNAAEDMDGFKDQDGCPDLDNDRDGVLDGTDLCPNDAETIDGKDDGDGCPEPKATSLVALENGRIVTKKPLGGFVRGSADPSEALRRDLKMIAQVLRGAQPLAVIIVEAFPDRANDASDRAQALAADRAGKVRDALVREGLSGDTITAAAGDPKSPPEGGASLVITAEAAQSDGATKAAVR